MRFNRKMVQFVVISFLGVQNQAHASILDDCLWNLFGIQIGLKAPAVDLSFNMQERHSSQSRQNAIVAAASGKSHKPLFSSDQMEVVGRNIKTGQDFLFVVNGDNVQGLPMDISKPRWKTVGELANATFILENRTILNIEHEAEFNGVSVDIKPLDFDPSKIVDLLNLKTLTFDGLKRLAISENRDAILQLLLSGKMKLDDLTSENVLIGVSQGNMRQYVLIRNTNVFYSTSSSKPSYSFVPVLSATSVGKLHHEYKLPITWDRLNLDNGTSVVVNPREDE